MLFKQSVALLIPFFDAIRLVYYKSSKEKAAGLLLLFPKEEARCSAPLLSFSTDYRLVACQLTALTAALTASAPERRHRDP